MRVLQNDQRREPEGKLCRPVPGLGGDEVPVIVLSFGYPARLRDPDERRPESWLAGAGLHELGEVRELPAE